MTSIITHYIIKIPLNKNDKVTQKHESQFCYVKIM